MSCCCDEVQVDPCMGGQYLGPPDACDSHSPDFIKFSMPALANFLSPIATVLSGPGIYYHFDEIPSGDIILKRTLPDNSLENSCNRWQYGGGNGLLYSIDKYADGSDIEDLRFTIDYPAFVGMPAYSGKCGRVYFLYQGDIGYFGDNPGDVHIGELRIVVTTHYYTEIAKIPNALNFLLGSLIYNIGTGKPYLSSVGGSNQNFPPKRRTYQHENPPKNKAFHVLTLAALPGGSGGPAVYNNSHIGILGLDPKFDSDGMPQAGVDVEFLNETLIPDSGITGSPCCRWITIDRWIGSKVIPNNLKDIPSSPGEPSIWETLKLDRVTGTSWQWRVMLVGTGGIPAGTGVCLAQTKKAFQTWIAPISDLASSVSFKVALANNRWTLADPAAAVVGGTFKLALSTTLGTQFTPDIPYNATASQILTELTNLSTSVRAGTITVTGDFISQDNIVITCVGSLDDSLDISGISNLDGANPSLVPTTGVQGGTSSNEVQYISTDWPATTGTFQLSLTAKGSIQVTGPIPITANASIVELALNTLPNCNTPPNGDVSVIKVTLSGRDYFRIEFKNGLALTDVPQITGTSSLELALEFINTNSEAQSSDAFIDTFVPLNVGVLYKSWIRKGYGNVDYRAVNNVLKTFTTNPDGSGVPGAVTVENQPCGFGISTPKFPCSGPGGEAGVLSIETIASSAKAEFIPTTGEINVTTSLPFEFVFQIRCIGCYYSPQFSLWGVYESSKYRHTSIYDINESNVYEPTGALSCRLPNFCRNWAERYSNVPHLFRQKIGIDGYDASTVQDECFTDGVTATRPVDCVPDVVYLGGGFWLESFFSRSYNQYSCTPGSGIQLNCLQKPRREYSVEHCVGAIDRLRAIYKEKFGYWGGWIDEDSLTLGYIRCRFDKYDLTGVKVLFLGGLPIGRVPQKNVFAGSPNGLGGGGGGGVLSDEPGDDFFGGSNCWNNVLSLSFEPGTLEPLKKWLNQGGGVLVVDGGAFPYNFFTELGIDSTVEQPACYSLGSVTPNTVNGSWFTTPAWGPENPVYTDPDAVKPLFKACYVEPVSHPFTTAVAHGIDDNDDPVYVPDSSDTGIFGSSIAGVPLGGPNLPQRGLINISQKYPNSYQGSGSGYTCNHFNIGLKPSSALLAYTTCLPKVTPSSNAVILGRVKGEMPVAPFGGPTVNTITIDYPCIAAETWKAKFTIKYFDDIGNEYETAELDFHATASDIKTALEAIPAIGNGLIVTGGPLPTSVTIEFATTATTGSLQNLMTCSTNSFLIERIRAGGIGNDIQRIDRIGNPSRVIVASISELVEPDAWGDNWASVSAISTPGAVVTQDGDETLFSSGVSLLYQDVTGACITVPIPYYSKDGYQWGLGLSWIASTRFLKNLLQFVGDY